MKFSFVERYKKRIKEREDNDNRTREIFIFNAEIKTNAPDNPRITTRIISIILSIITEDIAFPMEISFLSLRYFARIRSPTLPGVISPQKTPFDQIKHVSFKDISEPMSSISVFHLRDLSRRINGFITNTNKINTGFAVWIASVTSFISILEII